MTNFFARKLNQVLVLCMFLGASSIFVAGQTPSPSPTPDTATQTPPDTSLGNPLKEPTFPTIAPRALPPLPNLTRLGVDTGNTISLTLSDAIKRALLNNNDIEVARDDVRFAETTLRSLQGVYDPIFSITPQYNQSITPQQSVIGGGGTAGTVSTTNFTFSPSLTKAVSTGGGQYTVTFNNTRTSSSSTNSILSPFYSSTLGFTYVQPIMRNREIDFNRHQIRVQKKRLEQSDADFRRKTIDIISQVQSGYWDLVFALRDQQIQLENLNLSRENLKRVEAQIAAGAAAPLARAEVQTELANRESTLLLAVQFVSIAENALKDLILKDPTSGDWTAQFTPTDAPTFDSTPVNLNDALAEARKNRPELQRLRLQNDINALDIQFFKDQTKPQMDFVGTFSSNGLAGSLACVPSPTRTCPTAPTNLVGGFGKDVANLFGFTTRTITLGVVIQIPLRNTTAKANLAGVQIQKEQLDASARSTEQLVEVDVRNAAQAVETSRRRVLTAREARANAELQLEGEQRLYSVGRSTTFLLFQRENALANARDAELRAETDYNKALAALQHATSSTLRANNITVDTPGAP
jgi:HAE1 family hydrophobic/amphiphilic exporter-1